MSLSLPISDVIKLRLKIKKKSLLILIEHKLAKNKTLFVENLYGTGEMGITLFDTNSIYLYTST